LTATAERAVPEPSFACQGCGGRQLRPSLGRRSGDKERSAKGEHPYRCQSCGLRFYSARIDTQQLARRRRTTGRRIRSSWKHNRGLAVRAGVFLLMLLMFFLCLHYLTSYQPDNSSSRSLTPRIGIPTYSAASRPVGILPPYFSIVS
jgi:hypothetical protein